MSNGNEYSLPCVLEAADERMTEASINGLEVDIHGSLPAVAPSSTSATTRRSSVIQQLGSKPLRRWPRSQHRPNLCPPFLRNYSCLIYPPTIIYIILFNIKRNLY